MPRTTLIVSANPNPESFTAALARASADAARALGDRVLISDLYAMRFQASAGMDDPGDPLKMQEQAAAAGTLPADVATEAGKILVADRIVFHFPLWWFGPPAILKGWMDRCLVHGLIHDVANRFDTGRLKGRRALFCVTTGANAAESGPDGKEGDTRLWLQPLAYTLRYCGMDVAEPLCLHGVHGYVSGAGKAGLEARLSRALDAQHQVVATLDRRALLRFNGDGDFDANGRLRPEAPSHSPFIRHPA